MQEQFNTLHTKLDQNTNAEAIADAMESKIEEVVARQMRSKDNQINATYYQSLANELKNHDFGIGWGRFLPSLLLIFMSKYFEGSRKACSLKCTKC